ncbi:MAG: HAMP domain-containing histidine kinase [Lachnospiraceae bacterium]|nr:HAMP domain-containing histidine kinase [Lachnospiraceae bacterium]
MDYLDELFMKWKEGIKNCSLKISLSWYIFLAIMAVIVCSMITILFCEGWLNLLAFQGEQQGVIIRYGNGAFQIIIRQGEVMDSNIYRAIQILDMIQYACILFYSVAAILVVSRLYFKKKLEEPLRILHQEAEAVAKEDLSFCCQYNSGDEMGEICKTFDELRKQLIFSRQKNQDIIESQRQLNAAFAHDLRTPLTVMKGYIEMIMQFYPKGNMPEEKLYENLELLYKQVLRMEAFSGTMKEIHGFEEMKVEKKQLKLCDIRKQIEESIRGLRKTSEKSIELAVANTKGRNIEEDEIYVDERFLLETVENLLGNALRFCQKKVLIKVEQDETFLRIYVKDDGKGFEEKEISMAWKPYYTGDSADGEHFGLGLSICKNLCEKHGGSLSLSNSLKGGAIACAEFYCG